MVNDSVGDLITRIKNAYLARQRTLSVPYFKLGEKIGEILVKNGYLESVSIEEKSGKKTLLITLKYDNKIPALTDIKRVSRPGLRIYVKKNNIPRVLGGLGITILSTPKGVMTGEEAKKQKLGGEILCKAW